MSDTNSCIPAPYRAALWPLRLTGANRITTYPAQWEALSEDGRHVFIHYRHGELTIYVGPPGGEKQDAPVGERWFWGEVGERHGGMIELGEVCEATGLVVLGEDPNSTDWPMEREFAKRLGD